MRSGTIVRRAGAWLAGAALLAACDAPTAPARGETAVAGEPSMLIAAQCASETGQRHNYEIITTPQTWTRAGNPHRVFGTLNVRYGGRLTLEPGTLVCFEYGASLNAELGGRVVARGRDTAQVVLTAYDVGRGWSGIGLHGAPAGPSYLTNVRIEHVNRVGIAVATGQHHPVYVDSALIRQTGQAVALGAAGSRLSRSRVDITTNRLAPAVTLSAGTRFEQTVVRGAAATGVQVYGPEALLMGGRIEGSGGVGLAIPYEYLPNRYSTAVRVVGGLGYPVDLSAGALARMYGTPALQDSLRGNARDTLTLHGGVLQGPLTVGPRIPVRLLGTVYVDSGGTLTAQAGARFISGSYGRLAFQRGGRLVSRGSAASPVVFTADDPAVGWGGIELHDSQTGVAYITSYVTNTRIELTDQEGGAALSAWGNHRVIVDSTVIRHTGRALEIASVNSRVSRTRVDTTFVPGYAAVHLGANTRLESTRVVAPAGYGIYVNSPSVVVASCEVRDGDSAGMALAAPVVVRNCNFVNNRMDGVQNHTGTSADVRGNWWGSTGGPSGPGGDGITGPLVYSPWRTTPYVLPYLPSF